MEPAPRPPAAPAVNPRRFEEVVVSSPPVPPRGPRDPEQGDPVTRPETDDPTGIRALLSGLGDPGPMPPDLVDRINASIAAEQAARARQDDRVVPLHRRPRGWQKYGLVAAAVAGLAIGVPALLGTGPRDVMASLSRSSNDSAGAASSAQEAPLSSPPASLTPGTAATPSAAGTGARATSAVGRVTMMATGTGYTSARLATQARDVLLSGSTPSTATEDARDADGLRECLTAMGVPAWTPVVADLATYDGNRAVVAVVSSDTGQTVYAVPTWCDATHAQALAGPLPIH
jgi:hypothetical protein